MDFWLSFLALNLIVFFSYISEAASCIDGPIPSSTPAVEDYQRAAEQICKYTPSVWLGIGIEGASPSSYYVAIAGNFTGPEKTECWNAFNDIISQCIEFGGIGGSWNWPYNSSQQLYYLYGVWTEYS